MSSSETRARMSATAEAGSSDRSALLSTMTGVASASQTIARYRSIRRALRSSASAVTRKIVSTFAAMICAFVALPAAFRATVPRRSRRR